MKFCIHTSVSPDFGNGILPAIYVLLLYSFALPIPLALFYPRLPVKAPVLLLNFNLFADSRRLSNFLTPTKLSVSVIRLVLIFMSSGESVARLGLRLTSKTHGFRSESSRMSKPNTIEQSKPGVTLIDLPLEPKVEQIPINMHYI